MQWGVAMTDWISVDDRLPEREGLYICLANDERWLCSFTPDRGWGDLPVTHWKPANVTYYEAKP